MEISTDSELLEIAEYRDFPIPAQFIVHEQGHCYKYNFRTRAGRLFSRLSTFRSGVVTENGQKLAYSLALHDEIRDLGLGRYSLWADGVYFSTSDNSDPRSNGRSYSLELPAYLHFLENMPDNTIKTYKL